MMSKGIWLFVGHISFGLAMLGLVLPILPTTPFLILSVSAYRKGSYKGYTWLIQHPRWGSIIQAYLETKKIDKRTFNVALTLIWFSSALSIKMIESFEIRGFIMSASLLLSAYLYTLIRK